MVQSKRIALLGFGRIEHSAFDAFFRVAGRRCPAYAQEADFRAADFVIVDASDAAARKAVRDAGAVGRSVVLGAPKLPGALLQMSRPLNLMQVVRALDAVLASEGGADVDTIRDGQVIPDHVPTLDLHAVIDEVDTVSDGRTADGDGEAHATQDGDDAEAEAEADTPADLAADTEIMVPDDLGPEEPAPDAAMPMIDLAGRAPDRADVGPQADEAPPARAAHALNEAAASPTVTGTAAEDAVTTTPSALAFRERRRRPRGSPMEHILVVDDSDIALRFMAMHLQRFGFQIHLARSGEEALRRVAERRFEFVFLDVLMEGIDGFQTCKAIKRADFPTGQTPPTVVLLTCLNSPADRLRGTMAGADAYLTKPLRELELLKVVGEREVSRHAYAKTAAASTMR